MTIQKFHLSNPFPTVYDDASETEFSQWNSVILDACNASVENVI